MNAQLVTIGDVLSVVGRRATAEDLTLVEEAFRIADEVHRRERRMSGDPYISHPLAVALLLAQWGDSALAVALGLLHDVPESVGITDDVRDCVGEQGVCVLETLLDLDPEPDVALADLQARFAGAAETLNLIIRVKLADRTHNARTWNFVPRQSAAENARQTRQLMVPLARLQGLHAIADELERLSAGYLGDLAAGISDEGQDESGRPPAELSLDGDRLAVRLLRRALDLLPECERLRYANEWAADLAVTQGRRQRLVMVAGFRYSARRLGSDRRRTGAVFARPSR